MATSVGFIGVGNMGNPMAGNVLKAGFPFTVFDRNPAAMSNLVSAGARKAASAQEVVEQSAVVLTCLPASPDVEALYLDRYAVTNLDYLQFVHAGGYEKLEYWDEEALPALLDFVDRTGHPGPRYR